MVQEGRKANRLRDGAVNVVNSDAPAQARYHADGTSGVPSLAYRHPDVPGSSFNDGTERVFSRGSADMQHYNNGTYGVVPQQVQSAVGYQYGTVDADIDEERKRQNVVPMIIQPASTETIPIWDERRAEEGDRFANMVAVDNRPMREIPMVSAVTTPVMDQTPSNAVITSKEVPPVVLDTSIPIKSVPAPNVSVIPAIPDRLRKVPLGSPDSDVVSVTNNPTVVTSPLAVAPDQLNKEELAGLDVVNTQNTPATVTSAVPTTTTTPTVPSKVDPYAGIEPTLRKDFETDPVKAARKIRSVSEIVEELAGKQKTEKSFTDSLANLFTASGFKEELGLNNQDIIRMAISTAVGAKKFGVNRALAYAGKQAFEDSNKRNAQAQAEAKAIRTAAVQIRGQEIRDVRNAEDAAAREQRDIIRENARAAHERFKAEQAVRMQEIKERFERDRDILRYQQDMQKEAMRLTAQDNRMNKMFGFQQALIDYREDKKQNSPNAIVERLSANIQKASSAVGEILDRSFGADNIQGKANPNREGFPTKTQATQQVVSALANAGYDMSNPDVYMQATSVINSGIEKAIADKKSGRVDIPNVTPYIMSSIMQQRLKIPSELLNVGKDNKPMPAEKLTSLFKEVRSLALDPETGKVNTTKEAEIANGIFAEWNGPNGKKHRAQFKGTENESAFAQFMQASLTKLKQ
jgi:hypothetical protein